MEQSNMASDILLIIFIYFLIILKEHWYW